MRTFDKPSAVFAGLLVAALLAVSVLLGFGQGLGRPGPASTPRADGTGVIICAFNMSWDGSHCR